MSSWVKVGAKCVCIKQFPDDGSPTVREPMLNEVLTISAVENHICECGAEHALAFVEIGPEKVFFGMITVQGFWCSSHFRPLVSAEDDAAMFTEIARHAKIDATTEQLERAWRESEHVIADDQSLRYIEERKQK